MKTLTHSPIIALLKENGHRLTIARKAIINIFETNHKPVSVEQINDKLVCSKINVNKSTLYREIDFLVTQKILKPIQLQEKNKRYELVHLSHHHHLICQICKKIEDFEIENCIDSVISRVTNDYSFSVSEHILDIYGICKQCQTTTKP